MIINRPSQLLLCRVQLFRHRCRGGVPGAPGPEVQINLARLSITVVCKHLHFRFSNPAGCSHKKKEKPTNAARCCYFFFCRCVRLFNMSTWFSFTKKKILIYLASLVCCFLATFFGVFWGEGPKCLAKNHSRNKADRSVRDLVLHADVNMLKELVSNDRSGGLVLCQITKSRRGE